MEPVIQLANQYRSEFNTDYEFIRQRTQMLLDEVAVQVIGHSEFPEKTQRQNLTEKL